MQLPYSEELNIGYLSRLFDNTTKGYFEGLDAVEVDSIFVKLRFFQMRIILKH